MHTALPIALKDSPHARGLRRICSHEHITRALRALKPPSPNTLLIHRTPHYPPTMAALNALTTSASTLAGPVLRQQRSRKFVSVAPSPSLLPSPFFPSPAPATHRPNKAELEARLAGAHVRAHNRRLHQSLGLGVPSSAVPQRTTRAAASSFTSNGTPAPPTTTTTTTAPPKEASPLYHFPYPQAGNPITFPSAPSPSMLPPPPFSPRRPFFPQRRSRAPVHHQGAVVGLGLSAGAGADGHGASSLSSFSEQDAPLTPHHVFPDTLRRTPGAPLRAKPQETTAGASYFHLPADILSPGSAGKGQQATVGLGIFNLALAQEFPVQRPFPVLL
ncbi:hypothetical protein C8Q73DRAFT_831857 [Cubamyces lactineus]|nr:hypothetical protein C8Q73DRAFT_831857 [Cubamyces lactineus]